ncbi:MAG: hypothetical protein KAI26_09685 [Nanoarchaeota archaeon]|nr:hypothetical protein [Nanoarchaeota archaeon]
MSDINELKELLKLNFTRIQEDVDRNQKQIDILIVENNKLRNTVSTLAQQLATQKEDKLKKEVIHKFRRHKKEIIKNKIMESVRLKRVMLPELKEIIVDQMVYCSKATFYRYYDELRKEGTISIMNKILVSNVLSIV